jgi:hypothetical protein
MQHTSENKKNSSYYSLPKSHTNAAKNIARENLFYKMHRHISQFYLPSNPIFSYLEEKILSLSLREMKPSFKIK